MTTMQQKIYDLHCHSDRSDGILSPEALVSRAKAQNVDVLALTDHDSVAGLAQAEAHAREHGIEFINGIELSCVWQKRSIHVVGLAFDRDHEVLLEVVADQQRRRTARNLAIVEALENLGFEGVYDCAKHKAGSEGTLGRPHFAHALVQLGYVNSFESAFKKYLGAGKVGDIKLLWPDFHEVIPALKQAGGIAVLAHPLKYKMTRTKLCKMLEDFIDAGGEGVEVVSGTQQPSQTRDLAGLAEKLSLLASCGSDFHAPGQSWAELGKIAAMPASTRPVWSFWESP